MRPNVNYKKKRLFTPLEKTPTGFTAIEILISVAILAALAILTFSSFSSLSQSQILEKESLNVLSAIEKARSMTLSSEKDSVWGVRFDTDSVVIFKENYSSGDPDNITIDLNSGVTISSTNLNGGGSSVIFEKLTGETQNFGTTTLRSKINSTKNIIILSTGIAQIK
ncbi:MAG TPA: prepilin-type N-terminal cleavage/methylation domain-containing protein [Candidatus Paceibacterota bacterium]